ncbi:hypothetical protein AB0G74_05925 [Streptomyces sp. NPDC020875]|uniref:hypothetical protein n=1 Tax=Streptomyces sp. NPDC020875 TaxID=3154898 RepID=UPI0033E274FC
MDDTLRAFCGHLRIRTDRRETVGFTLRDGREFLGRILELDTDGTEYRPEDHEEDEPPPGDTAPPRALLCWRYSPIAAQAVGDPDWSPDDEWITLTDIVPGTFAHYDRAASPRWTPYPPP